MTNQFTNTTDTDTLDSDEYYRAYTTGFVISTLLARYYALRYPPNHSIFLEPMPDELPDVVAAVASHFCIPCIKNAFREDEWASMDHLLLCNNREEVDAMIEKQYGSNVTH